MLPFAARQPSAAEAAPAAEAPRTQGTHMMHVREARDFHPVDRDCVRNRVEIFGTDNNTDVVSGGPPFQGSYTSGRPVVDLKFPDGGRLRHVV